MISLDRFAYGLPDQQQERPRFCCDQCSAKIYEGQTYYKFEADKLCSVECLISATETEELTAGEE